MEKNVAKGQVVEMEPFYDAHNKAFEHAIERFLELSLIDDNETTKKMHEHLWVSLLRKWN